MAIWRKSTQAREPCGRALQLLRNQETQARWEMEPQAPAHPAPAALASKSLSCSLHRKRVLCPSSFHATFQKQLSTRQMSVLLNTAGPGGTTWPGGAFGLGGLTQQRLAEPVPHGQVPAWGRLSPPALCGAGFASILQKSISFFSVLVLARSCWNTTTLTVVCTLDQKPRRTHTTHSLQGGHRWAGCVPVTWFGAQWGNSINTYLSPLWR